jgi:hypothetical protein
LNHHDHPSNYLSHVRPQDSLPVDLHDLSSGSILSSSHLRFENIAPRFPYRIHHSRRQAECVIVQSQPRERFPHSIMLEADGLYCVDIFLVYVNVVLTH